MASIITIFYIKQRKFPNEMVYELMEASFLENRLALASSALVDAMMNKEKIV
jgi:hypothetical protein